jgi:L-ascorbate oxidase
VNNKSFKNPKIPYLIQLRSNAVNITDEPRVYETLTSQSLQIIFQNAASDSGLCGQHAWHVHGHSFYVVGHGRGSYDGEKAAPKIQEKVASSPLVFRDVVTSYPEPEPEDKELDKLEPGEDCGWTAVRLLTDNPGVWLVHCHLATHLAAGEEFIIYSHTRDNPRLYPAGHSPVIRDGN